MKYTILKLSRMVNYTWLPICNQDKLIKTQIGGIYNDSRSGCEKIQVRTT